MRLTMIWTHRRLDRSFDPPRFVGRIWSMDAFSPMAIGKSVMAHLPHWSWYNFCIAFQCLRLPSLLCAVHFRVHRWHMQPVRSFSPPQERHLPASTNACFWRLLHARQRVLPCAGPPQSRHSPLFFLRASSSRLRSRHLLQRAKSLPVLSLSSVWVAPQLLHFVSIP